MDCMRLLQVFGSKQDDNLQITLTKCMTHTYIASYIGVVISNEWTIKIFVLAVSYS